MAAYSERWPVIVTLNGVSFKLRYDPVNGNPMGHRYGLLLSDDAKTVSWTLDGKVMDTVDITGCFDSSPDCVRQGAGAYASIIGGGSYRENCWKVSNVKIYTSRVRRVTR